MDERINKIGLVALLVLGCMGVAYLAATRPGFFSNQTYLAGFIYLQLLLFSIWKFRERFFLVLILAFVWAGLDVPLQGAWTSTRWGVLAAGAAVGLVIFMKDRRHHFRAVHWLALVCIGAAIVSAMVSVYPSVALLKALSLGLLFLYASSGGRTAIVSREESFFRGLLLACEITVYLSAIAAFILHLAVWGNPNSLGLVMGVGMVPLLFWGVLVGETQSLRRRRTFALIMAVVLLFHSWARASIVAAVITVTILCIVLRRGRLLFQGAVIALCLLALVAIVSPGDLEQLNSSSTTELVYKGHREAGILGSRRSPWQQTMDVIREHPWFGSGFGTSPTGKHRNFGAKYASNSDTNREHGNSYLALLEWVGLLGLSPFLVLLLLIVWKVGGVLAWMRRTANPYHPAVPMIAVICAGLIHATFEDWLFAVGNYTCVFFWTLAFALPDVAPASASAVSANGHAWSRTPLTSQGFAAVAPGR